METHANDERDNCLLQAEDESSRNDKQEERIITIVVSNEVDEVDDADAHSDAHCLEDPESSATAKTPLLLQCPELLARQSCYFSALLDSGMMESRSLRIELKHLDPRAVTSVLRYLKDREADFEGMLWPGFQGCQSDDVILVVEAFDYLQIKDSDATVQALLILHGSDGIRTECIRQGWVADDGNDGFRVISIPFSRKKRYWRFWVCYLLCMYLLPEALVCQGQGEFTARLEPYAGDAGAVTLRRELVDNGLISREGDGSAYWRPKYTVNMLKKWLVGIPRKIV